MLGVVALVRGEDFPVRVIAIVVNPNGVIGGHHQAFEGVERKNWPGLGREMMSE